MGFSKIESDIVNYLQEGLSQRDIAKKLERGESWVSRIVKQMLEEGRIAKTDHGFEVVTAKGKVKDLSNEYEKELKRIVSKSLEGLNFTEAEDMENYLQGELNSSKFGSKLIEDRRFIDYYKKVIKIQKDLSTSN